MADSLLLGEPVLEIHAPGDVTISGSGGTIGGKYKLRLTYSQRDYAPGYIFRHAEVVTHSGMCWLSHQWPGEYRLVFRGQHHPAADIETELLRLAEAACGEVARQWHARRALEG